MMRISRRRIVEEKDKVVRELRGGENLVLRRGSDVADAKLEALREETTCAKP